MVQVQSALPVEKALPWLVELGIPAKILVEMELPLLQQAEERVQLEGLVLPAVQQLEAGTLARLRPRLVRLQLQPQTVRQAPGGLSTSAEPWEQSGPLGSIERSTPVP